MTWKSIDTLLTHTASKKPITSIPSLFTLSSGRILRRHTSTSHPFSIAISISSPKPFIIFPVRVLVPSPRTPVHETVRGWYIAMVQYSSLCEGAAVLTLGVVDTGDGVKGKEQVDCGREEVNDREKQKKDRTRKQPTDDQNTHHG